MILEFIDKTQIEVLSIFGGPSLIKGVTRDTLRIEVDPNTTSLDTLSNLFRYGNRCLRLFTYDSDEGEDEIKLKIGDGYSVFVDCKEETREVIYPPGEIRQKEYETIYIVTIAQYTYEEWQEAMQLLESSDDEEEVLIWRYLHE